MIERIAAARRVPLARLTAEHLRLLVSQRIALSYTFPVAIEMLEQRPLQLGGLYVGDLLMATLQADKEYGLTRGDRARLRAVVVRALKQLTAVTPTDWNASADFDPEDPDEIDRESLVPQLEEGLRHLDLAPAL
jgi:hypothetical protein